jgi:hypothetical protein
VSSSDVGAEAGGHLQQKLVAGLVAERVVDRLEMIEIDEHHRQRLAGTARPRNALGQTIGEQLSVRQKRQDVVVGMELDLFLGALPVADIDDGAVDSISDRREIHERPDRLPILLPQLNLNTVECGRIA